MTTYLLRTEKQPEDNVLGEGVLGTAGTHTFSVVLDREWPGRPVIWVRTSRDQKT